MRPRTSLIIAATALAMVGFVAASLGQRQARPGDADPRRSTLLVGPQGARAWADALQLLGVRVARHRRRTTELPAPLPGDLYAILDPAARLSPLDGLRLEAWRTAGGSVLAAGRGSAAYLACFRLRPAVRFGDHAVIDGDTLAINAVLEAGRQDSTAVGERAASSCAVGAYRTDTLLRSTTMEPVAVRITTDSGGAALLVADGGLFANRALKESTAGEFTLGLVYGSYGHVLVDEYHQGFGPGGGILPAARRWLFSAPAGWAIIQLGLVGLLVLLTSAVRFGPARQVIVRRRRSALEHVRALATALAAAGGHDVAVSLVVRGLRRRLTRAGDPMRASITEWLAALPARTHSPAGRAAAERLLTLTSGPADVKSVRQAAIAVEDVWQDLTP